MKETKQTVAANIEETCSHFTFPLLLGCAVMAVMGFNLIGQAQAVLDEICYLLAV